MPENLVLHITLPKTLALADGTLLGQEITFDVVSALSPFYASIDQVRLHGGIYLTKLSDLTVASMIYSASKDARALVYTEPPSAADASDPNWKRWTLFNTARNRWVTAKAARDLILNVFHLIAGRGQKSLANFSVGRQEFSRDQGMPAKLAELGKVLHDYEIVLKSGGDLGPGGHVKPTFAAKGANDSTEALPGRNWIVTGLGANESGDLGGKTVKFSSAPFVCLRVGFFPGTVILPFR